LPKKLTKQITMNVPVLLWEEVDQTGRILGYRDKRGVHSTFFRENVSESVQMWRKHPYICLAARHVVFISRDGHMFHRLEQELKLNAKTLQLPCAQEMKPEKWTDFLLHRDPQRDESEWLRSHWLLNAFSAWQGKRNPGAAPLSCRVDREGTIAKKVELEIDQGPGRFVTREHLIGLADYVQWKDSGRGSMVPKVAADFDRIDLLIEIPIRNLQVTVIVDTALYRSSPFASEAEIPELALEFRNLEGARFEDPSQDPENPFETRSDRSSGQDRHPKAGEALSLLRDFRERIAALATTEANDGPVLDDEERARAEEAFKLPESFLLLQLEWPSPPISRAVCVRWEKPVRLSPPQG